MERLTPKGSVSVVFFAHLQQAAGVRQAGLPADGPMTIEELLVEIAIAVPGLEDLTHEITEERWGEHFIVLRDGEILSVDAVVEPQDEIWLLPPIAGGSVGASLSKRGSRTIDQRHKIER